MSTQVTTVLASFPFKYAAKDWHKDIEEKFQLSKTVEKDYATVDGQIVKTVETTWEFASAIAYVAPDPVHGPPYFYADGNFYANPAFIFQKTHIKTSTYEAISSDSYDVTVDDYNVLENKHTITHLTENGKLPLAPTINSALSNLIQRPLLGVLNDVCDFIDSKAALDQPWSETEEQVNRAARRANQRATAIVRRVKGKLNPLIKIADTVRVIDPARDLDINHIVTAIDSTVDCDSGEATMTLTLEDWTR